MNRFTTALGAAALAAAGALTGPGCDLFDPSNVENPNVTEETFLDNADIGAYLAGLERQTAIALNEVITNAEIASDNYDNTATFFNQNFDNLNFNPADTDINDAFFALSDLRATARFGRQVAAADSLTTPDQLAEIAFFEGLAQLYLGELFAAAPDTASGPAVPAAQLFGDAVEAFRLAAQTTTDAGARAGYQIALARTYRALGDKASARTAASAALAADPTYVRYVQYDFTNGPTSTIEDALVRRSTFDDLQPLPRLDFLDPKFYDVAASENSPVPLLKAEEAHLILAEADLSDNLVPAAQARMLGLLALVNGRPRATIDDRTEGRTQRAPGSRPNAETVRVRASADDPYKTGLVQTRDASVTVPTVSGTSVTAADVAAALTVAQAAELLYLLRQEVFIAEGRRMFDLGLRWPTPEREVLANLNLGTPAQAVVPAFLPAGNQLDAFTYDAAAGTATIAVNLNRVLAQNRTDAALPGFF